MLCRSRLTHSGLSRRRLSAAGTPSSPKWLSRLRCACTGRRLVTQPLYSVVRPKRPKRPPCHSTQLDPASEAPGTSRALRKLGTSAASESTRKVGTIRSGCARRPGTSQPRCVAQTAWRHWLTRPRMRTCEPLRPSGSCHVPRTPAITAFLQRSRTLQRAYKPPERIG